MLLFCDWLRSVDAVKMYDDYTLEDLLFDDDFRAWVLSPGNAKESFWRSWIENHPEKKALVEEARNIILFAERDEIDIDDEKNIASWEKLKSRIEDDEASLPAGSLWFQRSGLYRIAACLAGLLVLAAGYFYWGFSKLEYATQFGEVKTIWLPDSSRIILNANSTLHIHRSLFSHNTREVSLTGEAFFVVRKNPSGARKEFVVHANDINVEVLGTSFNVNNRSGRTWVVLNTGKVQLSDDQLAAAPLIMNPGELGEYSEVAGGFTSRKVDPEMYTSWTVNQLIFENNLLEDVITLLRQNYGFEVVVRDSALLTGRFTGKFPADRPDILLSALSASFDLQLSKTGNRITIDHAEGR